MVGSVTVIVSLLLTLLLPIYPDGLSADIAAFFGLIALAAGAGILHRSARRELMVISPWAGVLLLAMLVGSFRSGETQQAIEDTLPYILFVMGLIAGRGQNNPRRVLVVALWVCAADSFVSLYSMPSYGPEVRSTYTYWKITAGLPLVGMYLSSLLRNSDPEGRPPALLLRPMHAALMVVMFLGMVASVSRGMMLGWLLGLVITAYIRKPSQMLGFAILGAIALLVYGSVFAEFGTRYLRAGQASTIEGRFREIQTAWETFVSYPLFGAGLGAMFEVDGFYKAFVHNMAAYHLWKFGLVGSALLALPLWIISRQLHRSTRALRAIALGGGLGIIAYLVTCAAYKTYYLVWMYGIIMGASLSWLDQWRRQQAAAADAEARALAEGLAAPSTPRQDSPSRHE
ncbi:MAG: O-antigen ligase family protein [Myxococcota bacterium]